MYIHIYMYIRIKLKKKIEKIKFISEEQQK